MKRVWEVAGLFFKLGWIAFGGPAAHIAMIENEVVSRRAWMSREHFLDLVGATNLIPGPNSTEMAIHCGFHRAGWLGLVVAGVCFVCPAVLLTTLLGFVYVEYGSLPAIEPMFVGIRPAVLAIIAGAVVKLGQKALKGWQLAVIGIYVTIGVLLGVNEVVAILGGGLSGMIWLKLQSGRGRINSFGLLPLLAVGSVGVQPKLEEIFAAFAKVGAVLFGSGYVLIAYLEGDLVEVLGWITREQLLDAVAIGQFTPGPVLSTSAFIGYQIAGFAGAAVASLGIFLPSFVFVALLNPLIPKMRQSDWLSKFLDAVNVSAVGVMLAVVVQLGIESVRDWKSMAIALASIGVVFRFKKVSSLWIVLGSALFGYIFNALSF